MTLEGLLPHLMDLRLRLIRCIACALLFMALLYPLSGHLLLALTAPLRALLPPGTTFIFTDLPGAFWIHLHATFLGSMTLTLPLFLFEIWRFLRPGLTPAETVFLKRTLLAAPLLFLAGTGFVYFVLMPNAWAFFLDYTAGPLPLAFLPKIDEYVALSVQLMVVFGLSFELPLALLLAAKLGWISHRSLHRHRRIVIILILVVAAILTPPDILSQLALAVPLWLLFESALYLISRIEKKQAVEDNEGQMS